MRAIPCPTKEDAAAIELAVQRATGRAFPYTVPLRPEDRHGYDDGSTVTIERVTAPVELADGSLAYPLSTRTEAMLATVASAVDAKSSGLTVDVKARVDALAPTVRELRDDELRREIEVVDVKPIEIEPIDEKTRL
jgi:hypothetical protein